MQYETQMKLNYGDCAEVEYEFTTSYPRHIDTIIEDINSAITSLSGVPGSEGICSAIGALPSLLETEKTRYTNFSSAFVAYAEEANNSDQRVCALISFAFDEYYSSKSTEELKMMVRDYSANIVLIDYAALTQLYGLDNATIADLIYLNGLVNSLEGMSQQEMEALLQNELNTMDENSMTAKTISDILELLATTTMDELMPNPLEDIVEEAIKTAVEKRTGAEMNAVALAEALSNINSLQNKLANSNMDIAANPYVVPGGHTFARRDSILKHLDDWQTKYDALDVTRKANINTAARDASIGLIVLEVGVAGFESRVINGKDWEDTFEDIGVATGGAGLGTLAGKAVGALVKGSAAGPVGVVVGVGVAVLYDIFLAPVVKEKSQEFADAWHEFWW